MNTDKRLTSTDVVNVDECLIQEIKSSHVTSLTPDSDVESEERWLKQVMQQRHVYTRTASEQGLLRVSSSVGNGLATCLPM